MYAGAVCGLSVIQDCKRPYTSGSCMFGKFPRMPKAHSLKTRGIHVHAGTKAQHAHGPGIDKTRSGGERPLSSGKLGSNSNGVDQERPIYL
jgi:hypothetical protein